MSALPCLTGALLEVPGFVRHGFYGRGGGVSTGVFASLNCGRCSGDLETSVETNRRRVADDLGAAQIFTNRQVHDKRVRIIKTDADPAELFAGDGMVTATPGLGLGITTADCAPVLFADPVARVIGAAHAGWKGALLGVTDSVVETMIQLGAQPQRIVCAIGPAIQFASYQVGAEFFARFQRDSPLPCADCFGGGKADAQHGNQHGHQYFDLSRYVRMRLAHAGIASLEVLPDDTFADPARFFSYRANCRRGESAYGRQMAAIVLL